MANACLGLLLTLMSAAPLPAAPSAVAQRPGLSPENWPKLAERGYVVWQYDPWAIFDPLGAPAEDQADARSITIDALMGETKVAVLMISNATSQARGFRVTSRLDPDMGRPPSPRLSDIPRENISLREVVVIESQIPDRQAHLFADALPLLNQASVVHVGARETRQVWCEVSTTDLEPGEYRDVLTIMPVTRNYRGGSSIDPEDLLPVKQVSVSLNVAAAQLPEATALHVALFSSDVLWMLGPLGPAIVDDLIDNGEATFFCMSGGSQAYPFREKIGDPTQPNWGRGAIDFEDMDRHLDLRKGRGRLVLHSTAAYFATSLGYVGGPGDAKDLGKEPYLTRYLDWMGAIIDHTVERGWTFDELYVMVADEVAGETVDVSVTLAEGLRERYPKLKFFQTLGAETTLEDCKKLEPYVDIWCENHISLWDAERRAYLRGTGKPLYMYRSSDRAKSLSPEGYFRTAPWLAWVHRLDGSGFWSYDFAAGSQWDDFDSTWATDAAVVYPGVDSVIPSKRWKAWHRGMQDYRIFELLDELTRRAAGDSECQKLCEQARHILDHDVADVFSPSASFFDFCTEEGKVAVTGQFEQVVSKAREMAAALWQALEEDDEGFG